MALLDYRNTPRDGLPSPAQLFFGRRTRTRLPTSAELLKSEIFTDIPQKLHAKQTMQKHYYDRNTKPLKPFATGVPVSVPEETTWRPAVITRNAATPRSYIVQTADGHQYRRNRRDIRASYRKDQEQTLNIDSDSEQTHNLNDTVQETPPHVITTRSGRTVKPPLYLEQYVT